MLISGIVLNTFFLVREIRRNEQQDAFINAVTHELKTPVASIRLYLETLQTRAVDEAKRKDFYRIMLEDSDRLLETIEQILRTGRIGHSGRKPKLSRIDLGGLVQECVTRARTLYGLSPESLSYQPGSPMTILGGHGRGSRGGFQSHRQRREVFRTQRKGVGGDRRDRRETRFRAGVRSGSGHPQDGIEGDLQAFLPGPWTVRSACSRNWPGPVYRSLGRQAPRRTSLGGKRGSGTREHVCAAASAHQKPMRKSDEESPMSRVLVVEDEQHLADGLRFNLEAEGYQVQVTDTGESALEVLKADPRGL